MKIYIRYTLAAFAIFFALICYFMTNNKQNSRITRRNIQQNVSNLRALTRFEMISDFLNDVKNETGEYPSCEIHQIDSRKTYMISEKYIKPTSSTQSEKAEWWYRNYFMHDQNFFNDPYINDNISTYSTSLAYVSDGKNYIILSRGPDKQYEDDYIGRLYNEFSSLDAKKIEDINLLIGYDPTNGLMSRGDILFTSDELKFTSRALKTKWSQKHD